MDCYRVNRHVFSLSRLEDDLLVGIYPGDIVEATYIAVTGGQLFVVRVLVGTNAGSTIGCGRAVLDGDLLTPVHPLTALAACAEGSRSS